MLTCMRPCVCIRLEATNIKWSHVHVCGFVFRNSKYSSHTYTYGALYLMHFMITKTMMMTNKMQQHEWVYLNYACAHIVHTYCEDEYYTVRAWRRNHLVLFLSFFLLRFSIGKRYCKIGPKYLTELKTERNLLKSE